MLIRWRDGSQKKKKHHTFFFEKKKTYLCRVAQQSRRPATSQTASTLLSQCELEAVHDILVLGRIDLQTALDQIQRRQQGVRGTCNVGKSIIKSLCRDAIVSSISDITNYLMMHKSYVPYIWRLYAVLYKI